MDLELFRQMLEFDSTSGQERAFAEFLLERLDAPAKQSFEVGDGSLNLLFSWGEPKTVFCSHMDTVPPYIAPEFTDSEVRGRGSCDAKGQVFSMYSACKALEAMGRTGFGLLLLSGEETGSWGAKAFSKLPFKADWLIIGEPTDNKAASASKGTKSFDLKFRGEAFHSGYPQNGRSAVEMFVEFCNDLKAAGFPTDPVLGETTWNIGLLHSDNPQNILSPELGCRLYFRTTFASDEAVCRWMSLPRENVEVSARGGDTPTMYFVPEGVEAAPVSFGSDAPHLTGFSRKSICGPGSILTAHRDDEKVTIAELEKAMAQYINFVK